jgi:ribonuclease G
MTRQNVTDGVREILTKTCPTCDGEGVVLSEETVAIDVERRLRDLAAERTEPEAFLIQLHPRVTAVLTGGPGRTPLLDVEEAVGKRFHFEGSEGLPLEHFAVTMEGSRGDVEERALPFREGEEVLVTIEEPHMYNDDDAVAKIDGYIISVGAAGRYIGQQKLVRIERVGRTAASASIVGGQTEAPSGEAEAAAADGDDERKQRRRGRRGGARRRGRDTGDAAVETAAETLADTASDPAAEGAPAALADSSAGTEGRPTAASSPLSGAQS